MELFNGVANVTRTAMSGTFNKDHEIASDCDPQHSHDGNKENILE